MIDLKKAKKADLEAEIELFRAAGATDVAAAADLGTNKALVAEIERLTEANGIPVKLDAEFVAANPALAKILTAAGAGADEIVYAEEADVEEAAKLDAEVVERNDLIKQLADLGLAEQADTKTTQELRDALAVAQKGTGATDTVANNELVYTPNGKGTGVTVVNVNNVIAYGKQYKDVQLVNGQTHRLTPEQFEADVAPRA